MENMVLKYIKKQNMIETGDKLVAGISGGADSVCLFFLLLSLQKYIDFSFVVVHVNHGIRKEASRDALYVQKLCEENNIPYYLYEEKIPERAKEWGMTTEEAGRKYRYQVFEEVLQKTAANKLAVAHHRDDQAETVLFQLFRGSGLTGMCGMRPIRDKVIRPMLCLGRKEIEDYLTKRHIAWCEDCTNQEDEYARNKIRHHILPEAETICSGATEHIAKAAGICLEAVEYIRKQTKQLYQESLQCEESDQVILKIDRILDADCFIQKQVLLYCMEKITNSRKDITSVHVEDIINLLGKEGNKQLSLPYGLIIKKQYDQLLFCNDVIHQKNEDLKKQRLKLEVLLSEECEIQISDYGTVKCTIISCNHGIETLSFPQKKYTKWFDYDKIEKSLVIRTRRTGDFLYVKGQGKEKTLAKKTIKEYMIQEKIPVAQRELELLIAAGSHICWVPGYRISEYTKITEDTKRILQIEIQKNKDR